MKGAYTRHLLARPLAVEACEIAPDCYSCMRRALARADLSGPVWLDLPGLGTMKLALLPDALVVADRALGHLPMAAWTEIRALPDRGLHEPVPCQLALYHSRGARLIGAMRAAMERELNRHLAEICPVPDAGKVLAFPKHG
ncbi:hypothetical protein [Sinisalibacter aestuarii]|uniref:LysR substrate-binding domain-containing protein n=1 Tax=Sinisalibacter aestuarii TaxID=2949426 RepID=A0ABQ5LWH5_9RHOB|nr:hypothetical protein [Sinisalibacter aestuarii]GKY89330.1 hypothetical protein STA1M1_31990 [Sinisalibacter aestuarii]